MKKLFAAIPVILVTIIIATSMKSGKEEKEVDVLELIKHSTSARVELQTGAYTMVRDDVDELCTIADLMICKAEIEPTDTEDDWCYKITFHQLGEEVGENVEPIEVYIHKDYIKIGTEYYVAEEGMPYKGIFNWTKKKCESFFNWQVN